MSSCPAGFWATRCARDAMLQLEHRWNWECWVKSCWSSLNYPVIVINCGKLPSRTDCEWSRYGIATCSQQDLKAITHLCLIEAIANVDWAWLMVCWVDPLPTLPSNVWLLMTASAIGVWNSFLLCCLWFMVTVPKICHLAAFLARIYRQKLATISSCGLLWHSGGKCERLFVCVCVTSLLSRYVSVPFSRTHPQQIPKLKFQVVHVHQRTCM